MTVDAQGCHEIGISQKQNAVCKKGEPDGRLPISTEYYTKKKSICKYSIVTKIGKKIRENDYEIENKPYFNRLFWYYFQWTFYVVLKNGNWTFGERKKSGYFFEKGVDNGEKMWYNTRVKQSRALRSHLHTGCDVG